MPKKILLVEDNFYILEIYKNALEAAGFEVTLAEDGQVAFDLTNDSFDLILLDIMLPKVNGVDLLKKWRTEGSDMYTVPILLLTNLGKESVIQELFKEGADGYILKANITPQLLVEEIKSFFEKQNQE